MTLPCCSSGARLAAIAVWLFTGSALSADGAEVPGGDWARVSPLDAGLDEARLEAARDYALTGGGAGYVVRGGRLVLSWGDSRQRFDLKSTTKSFGSAALGLAVMDGKVRLDDLAKTHHPTLGIPPDENRQTGWLDQITLLHLASQTAGFEKPGGYTRLLFPPGSEWDYSDSGPNWLAECLTLVYRRDLNELMFERLFTPLGIRPTDLVWRKNQYRPERIDGIPRREFGAGISANVDAMARFGLLWLRDGDWNGARLLSREFIRQARSTVRGVPGLPVRHEADYGSACHHYGFLWWNNADRTIENLPADTYWSWGLYDSLIVVMPALDLVVARAGGLWKRTPGADHYDVLKPFLQPIAAAVIREQGSPPDAAGARQEAGSETNPEALPPSPVLRGIEWAPADTILRWAQGSDNWPITWADDDVLYSAYGDGRGFVPFVSEKLSLGLARIHGRPPNVRGENLRSESAEAFGDGARGRKASGILCVDGVLYLFVRNAANSQLGWSLDHGATWSWATWRFTESFGCPTFLNFGRNYEGARDDFVYVVSPDHDSAYERADRFVMARVPKNRLADRDAWEFLSETTADGNPVWTADLRQRGSVFTARGGCYRSGISYNAGLKRYLWCQIGEGADTRFAGGLAIYDAPEPWGPWTTVFRADRWDVGPGETASFPAKWMSEDGKTVHLLFSGDDSFSVRRGTLFLRERGAGAHVPHDGRVRGSHTPRRSEAAPR